MAFTVLINGNSGSVAQHGAENLGQKLRDILGAEAAEIRILPPERFSKALQSSNNELLIGGGDGTIRTAAALLGKRKIPFGILPLGTMNLFAKDLSLPVDVFEAATRYKNFRPVEIDAASVNGELFLCNAMVGVFSGLAKAREEKRNNEKFTDWLGFVKKGFDRLSGSHSIPMSISHDGVVEHMYIKAALIANNGYEEFGAPGTFKKKSLNDGTLSVYTIAPEGALESIALLSKLALGNWKNANGLDVFETKSLKLHMDHHRVNVMLDGELRKMRAPLHFSSQPASLTVLVPADVKEG